KKYVVWGNTFDAQNTANLMVLMINAGDATWHAWEEGNTACASCVAPNCTCNLCSNFPGAGIPSAAVDSLGSVHIVYEGGGYIRHEGFGNNGGGFGCLNTGIGISNPSPALCTSCSGIATFTQLGSSGAKCIRSNASPSIAIDHQSAGDELVVAYNSYN